MKEAEIKIDAANQILNSKEAMAALAAATMTTGTLWEIQGAHDDLQRIHGSLVTAHDITLRSS